jgi:ribosome-associated protein
MVQLSRTQKKKNAERLQKLGERLIALDDAVLDAICIPEELRQAVMQARGIKPHEARRRQLQYIGRLMREAGQTPSDIQSAIERAKGSDGDEKRKFKQVETWRNELLAGSRSRLQWLLKSHPQIDSAHLRQLIRDAVADRQRSGAGKQAARTLFRYLRALID